MEVNVQSGPICGLISTQHEVLSWSVTAVEGSSNNSNTKHPPDSPLPKFATEKAPTLKSKSMTLYF